MTKSEMIDVLAQRKNLSRKEAETAMNTVLDEIGNALVRGDRVELRGFGSFSVKARPHREGRNPKTGEVVQVDEKRVPFFKAGKELRLRVDGKMVG
ncbi:MAG: integration host factor subunit beta [Magnetococcales bacterium]|nr:integration host factor subunit beta [Magnetococcales bacterium]